MTTRADRARLALLIAHYEATNSFADQKASVMLHRHAEFCATQGV